MHGLSLACPSPGRGKSWPIGKMEVELLVLGRGLGSRENVIAGQTTHHEMQASRGSHFASRATLSVPGSALPPRGSNARLALGSCQVTSHDDG